MSLTPTRSYSFTGHSSDQPTVPQPGNQLDIEFDKLCASFLLYSQYITPLINSDGTLKGAVVGSDNIKSEVLASLMADLTAHGDAIIATFDDVVANLELLASQAEDADNSAIASAAQALVSQSQAATSASAANAHRLAAEASETAAASSETNASTASANAQTAASSARISEDMAYRWAERISGPVFVPAGGDPVDDGFYSAHWWAIYAKRTIENGTFYYLGVQSSPPTTGNSGEALVNGMWYSDSSTGSTYVWNSGAWNSLTDLSSRNFIVTDDAGDGTVNGDVDATDFSSQTGSTTYVDIALTDRVVFFHKGSAYEYIGTRPKDVGVGGAATALTDYAGSGTGDHGGLVGLTDDDHPQYMPVSGSRPMTGALTLAGDATLGLHPVTLQQFNAWEAATYDVEQAAQDALIGGLDADLTTLEGRMTTAEGAITTNLNDQAAINSGFTTDIAARMDFEGNWSAGTYPADKVVAHNGSTWVSLTSTTQEPTPTATEWVELGGAGGATVGDAFPTVGLKNGVFHYLTVEPFGLYVYYDDGDTQQWVQTNGGPILLPSLASHDATGARSWRLDRDTNTLELWGTGTLSAPAGQTFTYGTKAFARAPAITATSGSNAAGGNDNYIITVSAITATQFTVSGRQGTVTAPAGITFHYHVIGEWDGVS